ncbi:hypothetical protein JYK02_09430 [Corallococcus macrosporus]|uniref:Uncharacterized protein n=2 Tax=Corallococcus macrosporus TaxID=35 RepID=A0ABS3D7U3_9BACT|nr:hypothetical protein [Corallococcus macrosporus]
MSTAYCGGDGDGEGSFRTVARGFRLLQVDEGKHVLLSVRADGTFAQALPSGEPVRIAGMADGADLTADGQTAVLWSAWGNGERTVWLWRSGMPEAAVLSQQARGEVLHDAAQSYVAFLERDGVGTTSVRVARTASCTPGDCVLQTLLQVQGGTPVLERAGPLLSLMDGNHRWIIEASSGAVTDLGELPGPSFLSPSGNRYGWVEEARVRLFDLATGAQVWDQAYPHRGYQDWKVTRSFMFDEERVFVVASGVLDGAPAGVPADGFLDLCGDQGCGRLVSRYRCSPFELAGRPAVGCSPNLCIEIRCDLPGDKVLDGDGKLLYETKERGTVLGPFYSEGRADVVRIRGGDGQLPWLEWKHEGLLWRLDLEAPAPTAPILFLPDRGRVLFHQPARQEDGTVENHLWTWDRFKRVDVGSLDGAPGPRSLMRDHPPALYLDVDTANANGSSTPAVVRVGLRGK